MAIVHTAVFDAMNAVVGGYQSYTGLRPAPLGTSVEAAIAVAAHDTLVALFSSQEDDLDQVLAEDLRIIPEGRAKTLGIKLGQAAADAILARREDDGSDHPEPKIGIDWIPGDGPGQWRQDPISKHPSTWAHWSEVEPFVLESSAVPRSPRPDAHGRRDQARAAPGPRQHRAPADAGIAIWESK